MPEKGHNGALQVVQEMSALWQRSPTVTVHRRPLGTHFSPWHRETIDGKEKGVCPCGGGRGRAFRKVSSRDTTSRDVRDGLVQPCTPRTENGVPGETGPSQLIFRVKLFLPDGG